ncbi:hypothetical protein WAI453_006946 [Rhynchosporium graminicola]
MNCLPGIERDRFLNMRVIGPRFINMASALLLMCYTCQEGEGARSVALYRYFYPTWKYTFDGQLLTGFPHTPHVYGLSCDRHNRLYMAWSNFRSAATSSSVARDAHREKNNLAVSDDDSRLEYAISEDYGSTWKDTRGEEMGCMSGLENVITIGTISPDDAGETGFFLGSDASRTQEAKLRTSMAAFGWSTGSCSMAKQSGH